MKVEADDDTGKTLERSDRREIESEREKKKEREIYI
jgi:hypothetical protein